MTNVGIPNDYAISLGTPTKGDIMSTTSTFGTQLIGQTEKTLNAILGRVLAGTGLSEPQWVTLTVAVTSGGSVERTAFAGRIAGALKISEADAQARIDELAAQQLFEVDDSTVTVTDAGKQLQARIRGAVGEITGRLWGDLPADELDVAARVLTTVLKRATAELAGL
jgi:DNA-binding MarR family transcriptional regulator